jgi:hypothetical protein
VTDGLAEVFDSRNSELGDAYIERTLIRLAPRSLLEIATGIFKSARDFGKTSDDQTLLIVRHTGG